MSAFKFRKHVTEGREFVYFDEAEYIFRADKFLGEPLDADTLECYRTKRDGTRGDRLRYNRVTHEFGVLGSDNIVRSYFVPRPGPKPNGHGFATNEDYWRDSCRQQRD